MNRVYLTFLIIFGVVIVYGCSKPNPIGPVSALQLDMAGTWQVDSSVYRSALDDSLYADSVYSNHFISISNKGNQVTIDMATNDNMVYTIKDSILQPYVNRTSIGCGVPNIGNTQISFSDALHLSLVNNQGLLRYSLYMHRPNK